MENSNRYFVRVQFSGKLRTVNIKLVLKYHAVSRSFIFRFTLLHTVTRLHLVGATSPGHGGNYVHFPREARVKGSDARLTWGGVDCCWRYAVPSTPCKHNYELGFALTDKSVGSSMHCQERYLQVSTTRLLTNVSLDIPRWSATHGTPLNKGTRHTWYIIGAVLLKYLRWEYVRPIDCNAHVTLHVLFQM